MSALSQNGRKIAKIMHNAAKKFDWVGRLLDLALEKSPL